MNGSTRAGIAAILLVVVWIVVYWRTTPPPSDDARVVGGTLVSPGFHGSNGVSTPERVPPVEAPPVQSPPTPSFSQNTPTTPLRIEQTPPNPNAATLAQELINRAAQPIANPATAPEKPVPKPGETIPPTFDMYEIQKGDNAQVISQKKYGTTKHWRAVLKANPLLDFTRLKPGRVIKVPHDPSNTQGVVVESPTTGSEFVEYTVTSGDTLIGIAQALYGKSSMWQDIRAANPSLDEDGTNLKPGMKLKVPPPTKGAGR